MTLTLGVVLWSVFWGLVMYVLYDWFFSDPFPLVPGPSGIPLIGSLFDIITANRNNQFNEWALENTKKYGNFWKFSAFGRRIFVVADGDSIKQVLSDPLSFSRTPIWLENAKDFAPNALFVIPGGDTWKRHRKLLVSAFSPLHLQHSFNVSLNSAKALCKSISSKMIDEEQRGKCFVRLDIHEASTNIALDVIGIVAFGFSFNALENWINGTKSYEKQKTDEMVKIVSMRMGIPRIIWQFLGCPRNGPKSQSVNEFFRKHLSAALNNGRVAQNAAGNQLNVLQTLLKNDLNMSQDEIFDEIKGFFIAGHETTANAVTSCLLELARNPACQLKLRQEIYSILRNDEEITYDSLYKFKYLENVIKEALRLDNVVEMITARVSTKPVVVNGQIFPAGVNFMSFPGALHRDSKHWTEPSVYNPDRFDDGLLKPNSFFPFGDGPHNCIGQKMAMIEIKVIIMCIIRNFSVSISAEVPIKWIYSITRGCKNGLLLDFSPLRGK